jgi:hypothetical protein
MKCKAAPNYAIFRKNPTTAAAKTTSRNSANGLICTCTRTHTHACTRTRTRSTLKQALARMRTRSLTHTCTHPPWQQRSCKNACASPQTHAFSTGKLPDSDSSCSNRPSPIQSGNSGTNGNPGSECLRLCLHLPWSLNNLGTPAEPAQACLLGLSTASCRSWKRGCDTEKVHGHGLLTGMASKRAAAAPRLLAIPAHDTA